MEILQQTTESRVVFRKDLQQVIDDVILLREESRPLILELNKLTELLGLEPVPTNSTTKQHKIVG